MSEREVPSAPQATSALATRRLDAARHLLRPRQVRESLALAPRLWHRNGVLAGLQAAIAVAVALPLTLLSPWPHLVGYAALGTLTALFGRFAPQQGRGRILVLCGLWLTMSVFFMSGVSALGAPVELRLALLALACGLFCFVVTTGHYGPPGALIFVFAAGAAMGPASSLREVLERTVATAVVAGLTWMICAGTEGLRHYGTPESPLPGEPVRPLSHRLIAAGRITFGSALAAGLAYSAGAAHPAWAAMGAVAVMQGAHLHVNMNRALQRMAGTVVGAGLVWLILIAQPSAWSIIMVLAALQFGTELIIGANYGLGQILVTPMALLMSVLAAPAAASPAMATERILDTVIGAVIGILLAVACSTLDDRIHLARHQAARERG